MNSTLSRWRRYDYRLYVDGGDSEIRLKVDKGDMAFDFK